MFTALEPFGPHSNSEPLKLSISIAQHPKAQPAAHGAAKHSDRWCRWPSATGALRELKHVDGEWMDVEFGVSFLGFMSWIWPGPPGTRRWLRKTPRRASDGLRRGRACNRGTGLKFSYLAETPHNLQASTDR